MPEYITDPEDPRRCKGSTGKGQCERFAEPESEFCRRHCYGENTVGNEIRTYKLHKAKHRDRLKQLSEGDDVRALKDEIALSRILIEERFNAIDTDADLLSAFGPIQTALLTVERLVKSAHAIEQNLGNLLNKSTVFDIAGRISQIIVEELEGIEDYEGIIDRINERIIGVVVNTKNKET